FQARMRGEPAPTHYTCRGVRRDGTTIWVENLITVVTWQGATAIVSFRLASLLSQRESATPAVPRSRAWPQTREVGVSRGNGRFARRIVLHNRVDYPPT